MQYDRHSGSPSRIPSFSTTPAESVPSSACLKPCDSTACPDIVRLLLDELISAAALQAARGQQVEPSHEIQLRKGSSYDGNSRASGARRSAITALREGIDARCDELASIEAMEALNSTADDSLLVPSPFQLVPQQKGTTLQELTDMCSAGFGTEALEVEGPADSWLRASGDLSASGAAPAGAPSSLALNTHGPSWDDFVSNMDTKLQTAACHAPLMPAVSSSSSAQAATRSASAAAVLRTAPAAIDAAAAPSSGRSSSLQGSPESSQRTAPVVNASPKTAAAQVGRSSPKPAAASAGSRAWGGYATARTPVCNNRPRSPSPAGKPAVAASPRSPGSAVLVPAPLRTRIPQQQQLPQEQERPLDSFSRSASSRIPSALSPQPQQLQQQEQAAVSAMWAAAEGNSASMGTGLDVLLTGTCRRSSSDNGSSASSRRGSMAGAGPRDDASASWMSSLRSAAPSSTGSKRTSSRGSSAAGTTPISTRTSGKQLHSNRSARMTAQGLEAVAVPAAVLSTPPAGIKSSRSIRTTPQSSVDGSLSKHAHLSLRRSGSLRSSSVSPTAAVARAGSARGLSPGAAALPLPLAFEAAAAAAAEAPTGRQKGPASPAAAAAARGGRHAPSYCSAHDSAEGAVMMRLLESEPGSDNWLTGHAVSSESAAATGGLMSTGGGSELLTSDHEILADPTAVRLFMELNEEIEAEGRAAMAAAEAAAAAKSDAASAAAVAAAASRSAVQVCSGPDSGDVLKGARPSSGGVSAQLPPAGEASWGSGGADDKQSASAQPSRRNTQSDAASPTAADLAALPAPVDEARTSNTVDTQASLGHETAAAPEPAAKALGADSSAVARGGTAADAVLPGKVPVSERLQAAYDGEIDLRDEDDAADQPSCSCKCVIM